MRSIDTPNIATLPEGTALDNMVKALGYFEVTPVTAVEMPAAQGLAAALVKLPIASVPAMVSVYERSGMGLFKAIEGGEIVGVLGVVPLNAAGLAAIYADAFNAGDPDLAHICAPGEAPCGIFGWGIASKSHAATKRMVSAADLMTREVIPHLAWYGRTVTDDGERLIMQRLGWVALPGSTTGLVWKPAFNDLEAAA